MLFKPASEVGSIVVDQLNFVQISPKMQPKEIVGQN
jgi:hypothetical protein